MRLRWVFALAAVVGMSTACSILVDTEGLVGAPLGDGGADTSADAPTDAPPPQDGGVDDAADASEAGAVLARDEFDRAIADGGGFGTADLGGAWSNKGTKAEGAVAGGAARMTLLTGGGYHTLLSATRALDAELRADFALDKGPSSGGTFVALTARALSESTAYHATIVIYGGGAVNTKIATTINYDETRVVANGNLPPGGSPTDAFHVRFRATGSNPTTLRLKAWRNAEPEPTAWTLEGTDDTAAFQASGGCGLDAYLSSQATNAPVVVSVERFEVRAP